MAGDRVDLDALIGAWRGAFEVAESALRAASRDGDLSGNELRAQVPGLSDERAATLHVLEGFAHDRHTRPLLVRLVASPREAKALLGLPSDAEACVFNVDGVLVASATIHADAWKEMFDRFISSRVERTGGTFTPFSRRFDYPRYIHGKSREDAVRTFLASRGISLPEGGPTTTPSRRPCAAWPTGRAARCSGVSSEPGISAFEGARLYLELAHDAKLRCAVVSGSTTTRTLLESARLDGAGRRVRRREHGARPASAAEACSRHAARRVPQPRCRAPADGRLRDDRGRRGRGPCRRLRARRRGDQEGGAEALRGQGPTSSSPTSARSSSARSRA